MIFIQPPERVYNDQGEEMGLDCNQNPPKWVKLSEWNRDHPDCPMYAMGSSFHIPDGMEMTIPVFYKKDVEA
jgi:hypothetical protein